MLGLRGSAEVVGSAFLTLLVGQAIKIQWNAAFLIYGFALVILCAYLFFVPKVEIEKAELDEEGLTEKLSPVILRLALAMALICAWTITINSAISLRVPLLVTGLHLGTSSDASVILSGQQLIGIVSGLAFAPLLARFQGRLLGAGLAGLGLSLLGLAVSPTLLLIGLSAIGTGFFYSIILTAIFHGLSVEVPAGLLNSATALVLLGCNFGSALSPYVLKLLGMVSTSGLWIFSFLGLTCLLLGALLFFKK
ncbi:MFS transporter [Streptococcus gallolyticus]|nr:MFS transporter [Streptococcus gallolyticus]MBY5040972.1 MFS transporter [Streptococcus gallolyticus]